MKDREEASSHEQPARQVEGGQGSAYVTRLVATLVLIPTVPMLLVSVAALALFYAAPTRFGNLIARLPGDEIIRMALMFAPATLFAIVVLAVLYARDQPAAEAAPDQGVGRERVPSRAWIAARVLLVPALPLLVLSIAALGLSFVAPAHFESLIDPLPGTTYLRVAIKIAPLALAAVVLPAMYFGFASGQASRSSSDMAAAPSRLTRMAVTFMLVPTVPVLLVSLAGLALFYVSPGRFDRLLARLPEEGFTRLTLVFVPIALLAVVLLAVLYLGTRQRGGDLRQTPTRIVRRDWARVRSSLAIWVLAGGLTLTAAAGMGLLGAALFLLLR